MLTKKEKSEDLTYLKNMYYKLFEDSPDAYFIMSIEDAKILDCNRSAEKLLNGTKSEIIGLSPIELSPEYQPNGQKSSDDVKPRIEELMQKGSVAFEWVHLKLDKTEFWANVSLSITEFDDEKFLLAQWRDITHIKKAEIKYQNMIAMSSDALFIMDPVDGTLFEYSKITKELLGYSDEEMKKLTVMDWDKGFSSLKEYTDLIAQIEEDTPIHFERTHTRKDGSTYFAAISAVKINDGDSVYLYASVRDISEQKKLQDDIFNSNQKLSGLFELSPVGIALTDMNGQYLEFNEAFSKICGYEKVELNALDYWALTPKTYEADEAKQLELLSTTGFYGPYEKQYIRKDGNLIDIRLNGMLITDSKDEQYIWSLVEDITDQKKLQKELIDAKNIAEETSRYKSEFLANMSHEIRTPMTAIIGFVDRLRKAEKDPERLKEFDIISTSGNTLLAIINDILDLSKIESGQLDLESHSVEIRQLLSETSSIFKELVSNKQIKLTHVIDDYLPKYIIGDEVRIKQIVFNLLSNAIKFTPENGSVTLEARYVNADSLYIAVSDTGIGIAKEKFETIFDAFKQEDTSTTRKFGGTGLGLSITSQLIKKMGGEIKLESKIGKGSKFYFEIPVTLPDTVESVQEKRTPETSSQIDADKKILIVEDNKTNQMLLGFILDDLNVQYDVANDGVEAVKMYQDNQYSLVLMDENMPNMNGIEATKQIRSLEEDSSLPHTPIAAVTANALTADRERFLEAGMDDYLSKPYKEEDMVKLISKYLSDNNQ